MNVRDKYFRIVSLMALVLTVLLLCSALIYTSFERLREQQNWVTHTGDVLLRLHEISVDILNMETGQRGYLLTKNDNYLDPYHQGASELKGHLDQLSNLVADNAEQSADLKVLADAIERRRAFLDQILERSRTGNFNITTQTQALNAGRHLMTVVRSQVEKMKASEQSLLQERTERAQRTLTIFYLSLLASTLLSIGAIAFAFRQFWKNQHRLEHEARERESYARIHEGIANATQSVSGDLTMADILQHVQTFLSKDLGILASRFFIFRRGRLDLLGTTESLETRNRNLVDQALTQPGLWHIDNIPDDYWKISSELGSAKPTSLAFLPLVFQGRRVGVIEMALFQKLSEEKREILKQSADAIAIGVNAAQARDELQELLERTQQQAEELEAQQEELRSSNEELEQQARAMESQQQAMNIKNRELESARMDLEAKAQELQRSSQYKSDFLAKMSHELRTPLNGLMILSTLLIENKEKNLNGQQIQFARSIHSAGNDLLMLINDILDLSKIEARKLNLKAERFSLNSLIEQMRLTFAPQANAKGLSLDVEVDTDALNLELFTDRLRVEQVLRNFLSNAIKFTEKGSVKIEAQALSFGSLLEISVVDTGIGISPDKHETVFDAFEQGDSSVGRRFGGTGLGLTISRELATLLGGEVRLQSGLGEGSRFTLSIPVVLESAASERTQRSNSAVEHKKEIAVATQKASSLSREAEVALRALKGEKRNILIVEDDAGFRSSVVEACKQYDFEPIVAETGELALAILEKHTPDAILLDIKLPGISGMGILEMIKNLPHLRHIPVHMISAMNYQHNALRMGALGYLTKPVTLDKVRAALGRIESMLSNQVRQILLIEDDDTQAQGLTHLIAGKDVEVTTSDSGRDAIAKLKEKAFDCIVVDLNLPDMTGAELLDQLNGMEISLPPIVIYTGQELSKEEELHLLKYSESIIIKGVRSPERLLDEVNLFLHRVESMMPDEKREMLSQLRVQDQAFDGKTVLLVDDDLRNVFALTNALEAKNFTVKVARDGIEALEAVETNPDIDIILMDIMMPRMDGFEAMAQIRKHEDPRIRELPVIALTAKAMREDHEKCIAAGANDYIPKPIQLDHLTTVLKVWLPTGGVFA